MQLLDKEGTCIGGNTHIRLLLHLTSLHRQPRFTAKIAWVPMVAVYRGSTVYIYIYINKYIYVYILCV